MVNLAGLEHGCGTEHIVNVETVVGSFLFERIPPYDADIHICVCQQCGAILIVEGAHLPYSGRHHEPFKESKVFQHVRQFLDEQRGKGNDDEPPTG